MFRLNVETLVHGGQGLAHDETGHPFFIWNALPGELVEVERIAKKKDYSEGIAREIITASPHRITPKEESFLSTSPWQIMDFTYENQMKSEIATETYKHIGGIDLQSEIFTDDIDYGYRNKMEFSFYEDDDSLNLAFFRRGQKNKIPVAGSLLASPAINDVARQILAWVIEKKLTRRELKTLIVRSNRAGEVIAGLFIKDEMVFDDLPALDSQLKGFQLYYSTHKSPASVPTKLLYSIGQNYLEETVLGTTMRYGLFSFFQVNMPVFEKALLDIKGFILPNLPAVDYYSGVGTISLALSDQISNCLQVEENQEATKFAQENISQISDFQVMSGQAEKLLEYITPGIQLLLDPPRAGLHEKVTSKILEALPDRIIYLSCNIATQARDLKILSEKYDIVFNKIYNFFPHTPHIEGLVVLNLKRSFATHLN